jgi:hypothetical protein
VMLTVVHASYETVKFGLQAMKCEDDSGHFWLQ